MKLFLHSESTQHGLSNQYSTAFAQATELLIVSAYLTEWNSGLTLNPELSFFRMIVGKDFGITRKDACYEVMSWLPKNLKAFFLVADEISGFHPKAVFWKRLDGKSFAIIGSSNLTGAAFTKNYEANVSCEISAKEFAACKKWVRQIVDLSVPVSDDWLKKYKEAKNPNQGPQGKKASGGHDQAVSPLTLPKLNMKDIKGLLRERRRQLRQYEANKAGLFQLFRDCASGQKTSREFYELLPNHWGGEVGGRLQGRGWERQGRDSDFAQLSRSFLRILSAEDESRDDLVVQEKDDLAEHKNPARIAFLSEMLCLAFPKLYPVLNKPVKNYLSAVDFEPPRGATEGAKYLDLAQKLRVSIRRLPSYPAKNLAELDAVIWKAYHD